MQQIRVGMVGYKFMGKAHSHAYRDIPMFFPDVVHPVMQAICGRDAEGVSQAAKQFGWKEYVTDWKELIGRDDIDLIDINAPSDMHKEIALEAAKAGKHLLCEKPLALTLEDSREMLAAAEAAGVKHMVGFNYRFAPAVQLARKLIQEGRLGQIYHFRGWFLQDWIIDPEFPLVWRLQKDIMRFRFPWGFGGAYHRLGPLPCGRHRGSHRDERDVYQRTAAAGLHERFKRQGQPIGRKRPGHRGRCDLVPGEIRQRRIGKL